MTNPDTAQVDAEAQAIAEAQAGYEGRARAQAPAPVIEEKKPAPLADPAQTASDEDPDEPDASAEPAKPSAAEAVSKQLEDLKAQVRELASNNADAATVRQMHGEIGNINRTLKQLKALEKQDAPAEDEMAAAVKKAEEIASEFPEIAGPLVNAIKALQARLPSPAAEPEKDTQQTEAPPVVDAQELRRQAAAEAAIAALDEVHPDRHEIRKTAEFTAWYANWKTPEYRKKVETSWNPAVVAQPFTDFKATVAARKRKQERLDAAATPQGLPRATPSTISDEEAARIGYERARGKRL